MKKLFEKKWISIFLIITATFIVYSNSFKNEFVYDDKQIISENNFIKDIKNLPKIFTKEYFKYSNEQSYRPVATLTYFINWKIFGNRPWGYLLTSVLLHILCSVIIFLITNLFFENKSISLLAGLLFALHPINVEAVLVPSFNEDILCCFFLLISFYYFIKNKLLLSNISYFFALFSKEIGISLILIIFLYAYLKKIRFNHLIPYILITIFYLIVRFYILTNPLVTIVEYPGDSFYINILTMSKVFIKYISLLIFPINLNANHYISFSYSIFEPEVIFSILFVTILITGSVIFIKKKSSFFIFWILFTLLPVMNFIPFLIGTNLLSERYLYISTPAFSWFCASILGRIKIISVRSILIGLILTFYAIVILNRIPYWKSDIILWEKTVKQNPESAGSHLYLGMIYANAGMDDNAIKEYEVGIKKSSHGNFPNIYYNLGVLYYKKNKVEKATQMFEKSLASYNLIYKGKNIENYNISLSISKVHTGLGEIYFDKGLYQKAILEYIEAIKYNSNNFYSLNKMGVCYSILGKYNDSIRIFNHILQSDPNYEDAFYNLAIVYYNKGSYQNSLMMFKKLEVNTHNEKRKIEIQKWIKLIPSKI